MTIMTTASGQQVNLVMPSPHTIRVRDIAHHLACINRFSGAAAMPYSVAQHSLVVVRIVEQLHGEPLVALQALLHDAHEAYTNDVPTPTKDAIGAGGLNAVQAMLDSAIRAALGIPEPTDKARAFIKSADRKAFATEWRAMMPGPIPAGYPEPANFNIKPLPWHQAEEKFQKEYDRLTMLAGIQPPRIPPVRRSPKGEDGNLPTGINK